MRILQGLLVVMLFALSAAGASASAPPAPDYSWAQPGTAIVSTPDAQPPAWILTVTTPSTPKCLSAYDWAQPGTAIVNTPDAQPPAWILTVTTPSTPKCLSAYDWAQPGTAIENTPFAQPPAWIPIH
jgi:hypothetical protein